LAPRGDRELCAARGEADRVQVPAGRDELPGALGAGAAQGHLDRAGIVLGRVEQPELGADLVHQAGTVAGQVARVVVVVVGVAGPNGIRLGSPPSGDTVCSWRPRVGCPYMVA